DDGDPLRGRADHDRPVAAGRHGDRVELGLGARRLGLLAAGRRAERDQRRGRDGEGRPERQATHCQSAHWTVTTPSRRALTATIAVWSRGRPPRAASARKNGKTTSPKRGSESSGQRLLGTLSGIARLTAQKSPYG